jgi:hypothetical protein
VGEFFSGGADVSIVCHTRVCLPLRTNAKSPGEQTRDFLDDSPGQRDYVGAMFRGYKEHLRDAGVAKLPCRQTFHTYIYLLRGTGAIVFDGAEAIAFGADFLF